MLKKSVVKLANVVGETGLFRSLCPKRVPVFMLHRLYEAGDKPLSGGMSAEILRSHLDYLARRGYRVLSMDELWLMLNQGAVMPSKSVMFSIDDGFCDHFDLAARVFDEFGFVLNFFVITGFLDQELWPWDDQVTYALNHTELDTAEVRLPSGAAIRMDLAGKGVAETISDLRRKLKRDSQTNLYEWLKTELFGSLAVEYPSGIPDEFRSMSWEDARILRESGHGVYPHTRSHRILSRLTLDEKAFEINSSVTRMREELHYQPEVFAYPTGRRSDYDQDDIKQLELAGIHMAFNTVPGYVRSLQNRFELPRFSLPSDKDDFRQIVNRFEAFKMGLRG